MKKLLIVLCVLVLCLSCLTVVAAALDTNTVATIDAVPYTSLQAALDAVKNGTQDGTIQLQQDVPVTVESSCDVYVDLNGKDIAGVTVTGGTFFAFDSQTVDFEGDYGVIGTVTGDVQSAFSPEEDGCGYLMFSDNGLDASFHYVVLQITDMVLRPKNEGETTYNPSLYYKCAFKGDAVVAENVASFGVALSIVGEPTKETMNTNCGYTAFENFQPGAEGNPEQNTGTVLRDIMKESNVKLVNQRNAQLPIYGRAYIKLANDRYVFGDCKTRTFKEQVELFDENWDDYSEENHTDAVKMFRAYEKVINSWEITNTYNSFLEEEDKVLRILNISNSHGQDSVWQIPTVLNAEAPDVEYMIAECYFSGALTEHVDNAKNNKAEYIYWTRTNEDSLWNETRNVTVTYALEQEHWDYIMFNESSRHLGLESIMSKGLIDEFIEFIDRKLYYEPKLLYNMTWSNPNDDRFHDTSYTNGNRRAGLAGFKETYTLHYNYDYVYHYNCLVSLTKKYLVDHPAFDKIIYNATPVQYAQTKFGVPQWDDYQVMDLYRDYTHLSDFARLMVAYSFYAQFFELEEITEVNVDVITKDMRATTWQQKLGDLTITDEHKQIIIDCVNHTLKHPLTVED